MSTPPKKSQTFHKKSHPPEISQPPPKKNFKQPPEISQPPPQKKNYQLLPPKIYQSPHTISQTPLKISQPSKNMLMLLYFKVHILMIKTVSQNIAQV